MPRLVKALFFFLALPLLTGAAAFGQQAGSQDTLLDRLTGKWLLQGTIEGQQTTHDINAKWVLGHQYVRIREVSRDRNSEGKPAYEAIVFVGWEPKTGRYACVWLDNTGVTSEGSIGEAQRNGDELPFLFQTKEGAFHTTFAYLSKSDSWEWRADGEKKGALQPFARLTMTRRM